VTQCLAGSAGNLLAAATGSGKKGDDPRAKLLAEQQQFAQQEAAATKKKADLESRIHTLQRQGVEARQQRQKAIKDSFIALKQAAEKCHATPSRVIRVLVLEQLDDDLRRGRLNPQELDEFFDKAFAAQILTELARVKEQTQAMLQLTDQFDVDRWKALPGEIQSLAESVRAQEENLRTLPDRLEHTRLNLAQTERQHAANAGDRERIGTQAQWAFFAALGIAAIIVAVGLAGVQEAFFGLVLPGAMAIFALVQSLRSASLDLSGAIGQLQHEQADLARQVENMPASRQKLAGDQAQLAERREELEAIHARHPELRGFNLRQF
jgi:hypothetical protein